MLIATRAATQKTTYGVWHMNGRIADVCRCFWRRSSICPMLPSTGLFSQMDPLQIE